MFQSEPGHYDQQFNQGSNKNRQKLQRPYSSGYRPQKPVKKQQYNRPNNRPLYSATNRTAPVQGGINSQLPRIKSAKSYFKGKQKFNKKFGKRKSSQKAELYEINLHLKNEINKLSTENRRKKSKIQYYDKVKGKLQKKLDQSFSQKNVYQQQVSVTDELDDQDEVDTRRSPESEILEIKNNLQDQRDLIADTNQQCEEIKAKMRFTNLATFEKELNLKIEENIRIKTTVDVLSKRLFKERSMINNKIKQQNMMDEDGNDMGIDMGGLEMSEEEFRDQIDVLMKQNKELAEKIMVYEEKLSSLKTFREIKKKEVKQLNENVTNYWSQAEEKNYQVDQKQEEYNQLLREIDELEHMDDDKSDKKQDEWGERSQEGLEQDLKEQDREINKIKQRKAMKKYELQQQRNCGIVSTQQLQRKFQALRSEYNNLLEVQNDLEKKYVFIDFLTEKLEDDPTDSVEGSLGSEEMDINDIQLEDETKQTSKKLPCIKFRDVVKIGYEIALMFKAKQLAIEDVEKQLFSEPMKTNHKSSITELQAVLSQAPFNFTDPKKIKLVSRYLVEDNDTYYVKYDPNRKQQNTIITSIFRKLTGRYQIFTEDEEQEYYEFFCYLNHRYGESIQYLANMLYSKQKDGGKYITFKNWDEIFNNYDEDIKQNQKDYLLCKLFQQSKDLDRLSMEYFDELFTADDIDYTKFEKKDQNSEDDH